MEVSNERQAAARHAAELLAARPDTTAILAMSDVVALGTPGLAGSPSVAIPEPALASSASAWPW